MNILPSLNELLLTNLKLKDYENLISEFITPNIFDNNAYTEPKLVEGIIDITNNFKIDILRYILEKADNLFRYSSDRVNRYYVKNYRSRTIVTMLGEVTYYRTEYISRNDNSSFIYVDELLGLERKERYTNSIKSYVYSSYTDNLSMRKVGINTADTIYGYNTNPDHKYKYISRQQIKNILSKFGVIKLHYKRRKETPDTIYVMLDEKYIHSQFNSGKDIMVKHAVIFESRETLSKSKAKDKRYQYTNKTVVSSIGEDIHLKIYETLNELYDYDKIKYIHILADGASWIKNNINIFKTKNNIVDFSLDKFHLGKAINSITSSNKELNKILLTYCINNDSINFKKTSEYLIKNDAQNKQYTYVLNNWKYINNMYHKVKIGCAMEQAIEHDLASIYASIPKAYFKENLEAYLCGRDMFRNNLDIINISLTALNNKKRYNSFEIKDPLDLSYFDNQDYETNRYHLTFHDKLNPYITL